MWNQREVKMLSKFFFWKDGTNIHQTFANQCSCLHETIELVQSPLCDAPLHKQLATEWPCSAGLLLCSPLAATAQHRKVAGDHDRDGQPGGAPSKLTPAPRDRIKKPTSLPQLDVELIAIQFLRERDYEKSEECREFQRLYECQSKRCFAVWMLKQEDFQWSWVKRVRLSEDGMAANRKLQGE